MALTDRQRARRVLANSAEVGFDIDKYVNQTIREFGSGVGADDYLWSLIIKSPEFKAEFPGILKKDGTMRVSVPEYQARTEAFKSTASQYGFSLNTDQIGDLVRRGVDPTEFTSRATAVQAYQSNPQIVSGVNAQIDRINKIRKANGDPLIPRIKDAGDAIDFFAGQSDRTVYAVYEGAAFDAAADSAGLNISAKRAAQLAKGTVGVSGAEDAGQRFATIAARLRKANVELKSFGLNQRQLEIIEFGGPDQAELALKAEQALKQREAQLATPLAQAQSPSVGQKPGMATSAPDSY